MKLVRYCHECGSVGPVKKDARDCCPDGSHAVMVPAEVAQQARVGFLARLLAHETRELSRRYTDLFRGLEA